MKNHTRKSEGRRFDSVKITYEKQRDEGRKCEESHKNEGMKVGSVIV